MIRSGIPLRLAFLAGLAFPSLAPAQDDKRPGGQTQMDVEAASRDAAKAASEAQAEAKRAASEARVATRRAADQVSKARAAQADVLRQAAGEKKGQANKPNAPNRGSLSIKSYRTHGGPAISTWVIDDPLEKKFGLVLADADDALRAQLALPAGQGVVTLSVKAESLADQVGMKTNDVITALDDEPAKGAEQAKVKILGIGKGAIEIKLIRAGKPGQARLVGPEHGSKDEAGDYWIGVPVTPVDPTLRSHLQGLPEGVGLVAGEVVADSPASKAGLKKFDILKAIGGKPLKDQETLVAAVQATEGKPATLEVIRAGAMLRIEVTPVRRDPNRATVSGISDAVRDILGFAYPNMNYTIANSNIYGGSQFMPQAITMPEVPGNPVGVFDLAFPIPVYRDSWAMPPANPAEMARVEAMLGEVKAMVEDLKKQVEAIKQPEGK